MPLTILKLGTTDVPELFGLQRMQLQNLRPDTPLTNRYIKLTLDHDWGIKWVGITPRRKVIFLESGPLDDQKINAYIVGQLAKDFESVSVGDSVFLAHVSVQKSATFGGRDMVHPCQLVIATDKRPDIWVIPKDTQPAASTSTANTDGRTTGLQGTTSNNVQPAPPNSDQQSVLFKELYNYQYTPLKDMKATRKVDVYGVVKFFKPPYKCAGPDYCMVITIVDPSIDPEVSGFKCLIFNADLDAMPKVRDVGDIVRFHRLKVVTYNDGLQGQKGPGFSCLVFDGSPGAPIEPHSTTTNFTLSELDKSKVKELREWASRGGIVSERSKLTLSEVKEVQHFDLLCQVLVVAHQPQDACVYLKVWDGTRCKLTLSSPGDVYRPDDAGRAEMDRVDRLSVDVCVNGQHVDFAKSLQAGDFVRFYNLSVVNEGSEFMFVLQEGTAYGRGLIVLSQTDDVVRTLMRKLETAVEDDLLADDEGDDVAMATNSAVNPHPVQVQVSSTILQDDPNTVTLSKVKTGQYFDLTCQVIKVVEMPETSCVCINVWDGTKMTIPCREIDYANLSVSVIPGLVARAGPMAVDVCLYDNHMQKGKQIKAGDFVRVTNLHAASFPPVRRGALVPQGGGPQMVELALHKGTSYGKGVEVLSADSPPSVLLKRRCDVLTGRVPASAPAARVLNGAADVNNVPAERRTVNQGTTRLVEEDDAACEPLATGRMRSTKNGRIGSPAKELRCMQQFASFTTGCERIKFVTISEAKRIALPVKFRVRARAASYLPRDVRDFVHLHCTSCNQRCRLSPPPDRGTVPRSVSDDRNGCRQSPRLRERLLRDRTETSSMPRRSGLRSRDPSDGVSGHDEAGKAGDDVIRYQEADSSQESTPSKPLKRNHNEDGEDSDSSTRVGSSTREASKKRRRRRRNQDVPGEVDGLESQTSNDYWTASDGECSQGSQTLSPVYHHRLKVTQVKGKYGTMEVDNLSAEDIIRLCRNGVKLSQPPRACLKYVPMSSDERGIHFLCPSCSPDGRNGPKVLMDFVYHFKLVLTDDTGDLEVSVSGEQAESFFSGLEAVNLYKDNSRRTKLTEVMGRLCQDEVTSSTSGGSSGPLQLECCVQIRMVPRDGQEKAVYQLVNTQLSEDLLDG